MHIKKLKIRKTRAGYQTPCAVETLNMLNCWAAHNDTNNMGPCRDAARAVAECMKTNVKGGKKNQQTINFHLARLQKVLK